MVAEKNLYDLDGVFLKVPPLYTEQIYQLVPLDQAAPQRDSEDQFDHYPDHPPLPEIRGIAAEARRQANCWKRALQLLELGYSYEAHPWLDTFLVFKPGRLTSSYEVCPHSWRCACKDFRRHRNYCKHTLAVYTWIEACKRNPKASELYLSTNPFTCIERHRYIARYVRKIAADLFKTTA